MRRVTCDIGCFGAALELSGRENSFTSEELERNIGTNTHRRACGGVGRHSFEAAVLCGGICRFQPRDDFSSSRNSFHYYLPPRKMLAARSLVPLLVPNRVRCQHTDTSGPQPQGIRRGERKQ